MSDERRQHYRVSSSAAREVRVSIRDNQGTRHVVGLIDLSAGGVALACKVDEAPHVKLMEEISVVFDSDRLLEPLAIQSQVRHIKVSDDDTNIMYGVRFVGWTEQRQRLAPQRHPRSIRPARIHHLEFDRHEVLLGMHPNRSLEGQ